MRRSRWTSWVWIAVVGCGEDTTAVDAAPPIDSAPIDSAPIDRGP